VGDVVPIDDVVVPVSLTSLESSAREAEGAFPRTSLAGVLVVGKGKLSVVVVPGTEKVYGLDSGRGAEVEAELNGGHFDFFESLMSKKN
jgi:hypothetical protein